MAGWYSFISHLVFFPSTPCIFRQVMNQLSILFFFWSIWSFCCQQTVKNFILNRCNAKTNYLNDSTVKSGQCNGNHESTQQITDGKLQWISCFQHLLYKTRGTTHRENTWVMKSMSNSLHMQGLQSNSSSTYEISKSEWRMGSTLLSLICCTVWHCGKRLFAHKHTHTHRVSMLPGGMPLIQAVAVGSIRPQAAASTRWVGWRSDEPRTHSHCSFYLILSFFPLTL